MPATNTTETDAVSSESGAATSAESSHAWGTTAFRPGVDVALVARQTVGLIERNNPSTRDRLWRLVSDDAPLDDILDELSSTGLKALPAFGLAQIEGSAIRIVARGRTTIVAELASGSTHVIDPSGVRTWIEELVDDVAGITITLTALDGDSVESSDETFAVLAGSVPASSLSRRYDAADDHAHAAESGGGWTAGSATPSGEVAAPESPSTGAAEDDPAPVVQVEREMVADIEAPESESEGEPSVIIPSRPTAESDAGSDPVPADPIATTTDPVPAAPRPADPQPASPQPPPPNAGRSGRPPRGPAPGVVPPSAPAPASTIVVGSGDGPTRGPVSSIFDDDIDDLKADAADAAMPISDAPVYGVLSFSNGERIDVDRAILIGRNPKVAGAVEGAMPHIMKFDGPGQGLSRTHAEVRVEGGDVLIEDLESTNGTEVQLPGQQRRRLRGGDPVVIVPGTLIDFGDELHCTLESAS